MAKVPGASPLRSSRSIPMPRPHRGHSPWSSKKIRRLREWRGRF